MPFEYKLFFDLRFLTVFFLPRNFVLLPEFQLSRRDGGSQRLGLGSAC